VFSWLIVVKPPLHGLSCPVVLMLLWGTQNNRYGNFLDMTHLQFSKFICSHDLPDSWLEVALLFCNEHIVPGCLALGCATNWGHFMQLEKVSLEKLHFCDILLRSFLEKIIKIVPYRLPMQLTRLGSQFGLRVRWKEVNNNKLLQQASFSLKSLIYKYACCIVFTRETSLYNCSV